MNINLQKKNKEINWILDILRQDYILLKKHNLIVLTYYTDVYNFIIKLKNKKKFNKKSMNLMKR